MLEVHARVERFVWNSSDSRSSSSHEDEKIVVQMKVSADNKAFHSNSKRKTYEVASVRGVRAREFGST